MERICIFTVTDCNFHASIGLSRQVFVRLSPMAGGPDVHKHLLSAQGFGIILQARAEAACIACSLRLYSSWELELGLKKNTDSFIDGSMLILKHGSLSL